MFGFPVVCELTYNLKSSQVMPRLSPGYRLYCGVLARRGRNVRPFEFSESPGRLIQMKVFSQTPLTAYELEREECIKRNNQRLIALGVQEARQHCLKQKRKKSESRSKSAPAERRSQPQREAKAVAAEVIKQQFRAGEFVMSVAVRNLLMSDGSESVENVVRQDLSPYDQWMKVFNAEKVSEQ